MMLLQRQGFASRPVSRWPLTIVVLALAVTGCRKEAADPNRTEVTGVVKFAGQPLPTGTIKFYAAELGGDTAMIKGQGRYSLRLRPGSYRVGVVAQDGVDTMDAQNRPVPAKNLVPAKYAEVTTSGLTATVERGKREVNFDLAR